MSAEAPQTRTWLVTLDSIQRHERTFEAAYFKPEGDLTVFKDSRGAAVYAVLTQRIVSIARQSADQPAVTERVKASGSAITKADLDKAAEKGVAKAVARTARYGR
ncbi:hypothetical protein KCMC57_63800 (plasmid) [Kitasatospora sp. CMC57]|uniref:Uncharacterized protein n=1 Tax=Kitasatospora sp. CMC57 TaxID=3231513 RepID=A0AB33K5G2_9ACTN